jgi:hypothetical protein
MSEKKSIEMEWLALPDRPEYCMRAYISLSKLTSDRVFIDYFINELAKEMVNLTVNKIGDELLNNLKVNIEKELSDKLVDKLFPKVMEKINPEALANLVALQAARNIGSKI